MPQVATRPQVVAARRFPETARRTTHVSLVLTLFAVIIAVSVSTTTRGCRSRSAVGSSRAARAGFTRGEISSVLIGELACKCCSVFRSGCGSVSSCARHALGGGSRGVPFPLTSAITRLQSPHRHLVAAVASAMLVRRKLDTLDLSKCSRHASRTMEQRNVDASWGGSSRPRCWWVWPC